MRDTILILLPLLTLAGGEIRFRFGSSSNRDNVLMI